MGKKSPLKLSRPDIDDNSLTLNHLHESTTNGLPLPQAIQKNQRACKGGAETDRVRAFPVSSDLDRWIRQQGRNLCLRQVDRKPAVKQVNSLIQDLQIFLKNNEEQPFFRDVSVFTSGSYYELVKIHKPNEFDIMLKLKTPSTRIVWTELEDYKGLFYTISFNRPTRSEIRSFLLEDERTISASKVISEMHRLVKKFVKDYKVLGGRWSICPKRVNSPAVTLIFKEQGDDAEVLSVDIVPTLEVVQGWPLPARPGPVVDEWLGKNARRKFVSQPVYFVPKRPKKQRLSSVEKESWRISFSHIEKEMIRFHGNKKTCCESKKKECCRKLCLRLLKSLFEGLKFQYPKELDHLCSYHGKTVFFHNLSERTEDSLWTRSQLSHCFMNLLAHLEHAVQTASLPHFFVPQYNLFSPSAFPKHSLQFLTNVLNEQRELGLPLLKVQGPAPALSYIPADQLSPETIFPESVILAPQKHDTGAFATSSFAWWSMTVGCIVLCVSLGFAFFV